MKQTVPSDVARDKQAELATQLAQLETMQGDLLTNDISQRDIVTRAIEGLAAETCGWDWPPAL